MTVYNEAAAIFGVLGGLFLVASFVVYAVGRSRGGAVTGMRSFGRAP